MIVLLCNSKNEPLFKITGPYPSTTQTLPSVTVVIVMAQPENSSTVGRVDSLLREELCQ